MYKITDKKIDIFWLMIIVSAFILIYWQGRKNTFCRNWGAKRGMELIATRRTSFNEGREIEIIKNCKYKNEEN